MQEFKANFLEWCGQIVECISYADQERDSVLGLYFETKRFIKGYKFLTPEELEEKRTETFLAMSWASPFIHPPHKQMCDADFDTLLGETNKRLFDFLEKIDIQLLEGDELEHYQIIENVYENLSSIYQSGFPLNYVKSVAPAKPVLQKTRSKVVSYAKVLATNIAAEEAPMVLENIKKDDVVIPEPVKIDKLHKVEMMNSKEGKIVLSPAICGDDIFQTIYDPSKKGEDDDSVIVYILVIAGNEIRLTKVLTSYGILRGMKMYKFLADELLTIFIDADIENNLKGNEKLTFQGEKLIILSQVQKTFTDQVACIFRASYFDKMN